MREHRDGGGEKRRAKSRGNERQMMGAREGEMEEREKVRDGWGSRSERASSLSCSPFKEEPGKQIRSPLFSWGSSQTHTQPPFNRPPPLHSNIKLTNSNFYIAPALTCPAQNKSTAVPRTQKRVETR